MIPSLLIANRGEIARRIGRTARRLGIRTIAVHSHVDAGLPFVREADEAVCIGGAAARESYLDQAKILAAARATGAAAIHPGYGFLSENAEFAEAVHAAGLVWVGAPPEAIRAMGLKDAAKARMIAAGVPVTPGYLGEDQSPDRLRQEAETIGWPVLIKAVAGGGGKGMRRVDAAQQFDAALVSCRREAEAAFGDDRVLIEKYVRSPRHIEVQVFGDTHGNVVHLFERDCSLQRRHQKVIEEAPAPGMDENTRAAICGAAVNAAKAVDYVGAGTIEFIADASEGLRADRIWFMEMNTRLQVEHPVTEAITGVDLVEWQLRVAAGESLPKTQDQVAIGGWAIEARLYAENPAMGFLPSTGTLERFRIPDGVPSYSYMSDSGIVVRDATLPGSIRIDAGVEEGSVISPYYDPMIAKIICHAERRRDAALGLAQVLDASEVWPVRTNASFLHGLLVHPAFTAGRVDTGFIEAHAEDVIFDVEPPAPLLDAVAATLGANEPFAGFRLNAPQETRVIFQDRGVAFSGDAARPLSVSQHQQFTLERDGDAVFATMQGATWRFAPPRVEAMTAGAVGDGAIVAPMPGRIIAVAAAAGQQVAKGDALVTLEAMKMEHQLKAPFDGIVVELNAAAGAQVNEGALLARIGKDD